LPGYANNPDFIRRFESEPHLVARLEHPHITPLHDFWRDPSGAYLVMRYLRGGSVRHSLQDGQYELNAASQLLDQVSSALDFAHRNDVIHRDIKPENILLDEDGNAYLAENRYIPDFTCDQRELYVIEPLCEPDS
jgi:serine/threonine protein kinase